MDSPDVQLEKGNPDGQKPFEKQMDLIKNLITKETEEAVLLYIDETHIRSYHVLRSTWFKIGRQKRVLTFGRPAHVSVFGAVSVHDGDIVLYQAEAANATTFLDFLRLLKERYPNPDDGARLGPCSNGEGVFVRRRTMFSFPVSPALLSGA